MKTIPEDVALRKLVSANAGTEIGRALLAHLARRCGWFDSGLMRLSNGEIAPMATEAKAAQRQIWLELRALMPVPMRHSIEELAETPAPVPAKPLEERKK